MTLVTAGLQIVLCDFDSLLIYHWEQEFAELPDVEVRQANILDVSADAYVSPANSYGYMDGGLDWVLRDRFGMEIERRVQAAIGRRGGMLPVGQALVVPTEDDHVPYLICAPTMEVPSVVSRTQNAYLAMGALLRAAADFARENPGELEVIAVPGLGTGVGRMPPDEAARQMRRAYEEYRNDGAD